MVTLFILVRSTSAEELIVYHPQETNKRTYIAGSHILDLKSRFSDIDSVFVQLGGVKQCSEDVNARVESELLVDEVMEPCRRTTGDLVVKELLQPSSQLAVPSQRQTMKLCKAEECVVWLNMVVESSWLPICNSRLSQTSFRSLAETLLRIREEFVASGDFYEVVAPNASMFREFYRLNQISNLQGAKADVNSAVTITRQLASQNDISSSDTGENLRQSTAVEPPRAPTGSNILDSSADGLLGSDSNASDTTGFTNSDVGPHASSTATTTELTLSYAYVVGAWILFNTSYFFLMRRK
ncbi:uncharacterized protein PHALS_13169 [Plasmopara halstedii]|uniref:Uncharacterized protein n=1 Tax=Plasmopara halstedii TaxID=4781 RepID=A0A0P1AQ51_PLAHL|nr:uncharacterized protein PHALS_13169 [Plasmopara halstedii]CEG42936.1 hypothetical protein PHALS_13169 [Plasmopara halstedii]|eukprot:XP_024579305.1 hypothetical protein PHALS_13169 [Plasmopara halstedii]